MIRGAGAALIAVLLLARTAPALTEPKTGVEYPDSVVVVTPAGERTLTATGAGLREKTFLKADVYTIVSYIDAAAPIDTTPALAILELDAPKRLQMDIRRHVPQKKLESALTRAIAANVDDIATLADDLAVFFAYFPGDAREGDRVIFDYLPEIGLTTSLNGEVKGVIANKDFAKALWSVWFGRSPEDDHLVRALVSRLTSADARR